MDEDLLPGSLWLSETGQPCMLVGYVGPYHSGLCYFMVDLLTGKNEPIKTSSKASVREAVENFKRLVGPIILQSS